MCVQSIEESGLTKCYSWSELLEMGRKSPSPAIPPKPEDLCTIMYTSGTTGNPKVSAQALYSQKQSMPDLYGNR